MQKSQSQKTQKKFANQHARNKRENLDQTVREKKISPDGEQQARKSRSDRARKENFAQW